MIFELLLISALVGSSLAADASPHVSEASACMSLLHEKTPDVTPKRFLPGLVGVGWDDLTNLATMPIFANTFKTCQTVPDGNFLVPDSVVAIPVQKTSLDRLANYHKTFHDYKRTSTLNINAQAGGHFGPWGASGSFDKKHEETKHTFYRQKSSMLHTQLTHHAYTLISSAGAGFDEAFTGRLTEIVNSLKLKLPFRAKYQAEMLIRDYGTHVVIKALTGAIVEQQTFIDANTDFTSTTSLDAVRASASASFLKAAKASISVGKTVTTTDEQTLSDITHHSVIYANGGPDINRMIDGADKEASIFHVDNLVGFEREGVFIHSLIHLGNLPHFPVNWIPAVQALVQNATEEYYNRNTIRGCTQAEASNFNFKANVDDGSCIPSAHNYTFNGMFQTCTPLTEATGSYELSLTPSSRCEGLEQKNPMTQAYSCAAGYEAVPLVSVVHNFPDRVETRTRQECHHKWIFIKKCKDVEYQVVWKDQVKLESFWCREVPGATPEANTGAMFGGIYQEGKVNIFTGAPGCPGFYQKYKLTNDVTVCISYDYEADGKYDIPFNGFFSCQSPVKACDQGYSQHLATIADNCAVYYCVRPNVFASLESPQIQRPPFVDPKLAHTNTSESMIRGFYDGEHVVEMSLYDVANEFAQKKHKLAKDDKPIGIEHDEIKDAVSAYIADAHKQITDLFKKYPTKTWDGIIYELENPTNGTN